jgi:hypothetical protein
MNNEVRAHAFSRCGAKTRSGKPCQSYPVTGRRRCRMHGGTNPGPPRGNQNGLKHGHYSAGAIAKRLEFNSLLRELREGLREVSEL